MKPDNKDKGLLEDMLKACDEIGHFTEGVGEDGFVGNRLLCLAIERCLEIVGEAASRVSKAFQDDHPEVPWQEIRGQRNILAHEYGNIDYEQIYKTATQDVLVLAETLRGILFGHGAHEPRSHYSWMPAAH